jgi:hypothetical protein
MVFQTGQQAEQVPPTTLEQVKGVAAKCVARHDALRALQQQSRRIDSQMTSTQKAVFIATQERDRAKRALAAVLGGESDGSMAETKILKATLDAAEATLLNARDDRTLVKEAAEAIKGKIAEADKAYLEALIAVRTLAKSCFLTVWSRSRMFANNCEGEFDWRLGTLTTLLNRLPLGDLRSNLALLETFLSGDRFTVKVERGFWVRKSDVHRPLQPHETLSIPKALDYRSAFDELCTGRLELVKA